jgi:hypothetical protein
VPLVEDVTVDPDVVGAVEAVGDVVNTGVSVVDGDVSAAEVVTTGLTVADDSVSVDDVVGAGANVDRDNPPDDPPMVSVGVIAPNAADAGPELPCLLANAAVAAPPITAERMMNFLLEEDFS